MIGGTASGVNRMKKLITIDELANRCGYLFNAMFDDNCNSCPNNGYNCRHPESLEEDGVGVCLASSCPIAYTADEQDCKKYGVDYDEDTYMIFDEVGGE